MINQTVEPTTLPSYEPAYTKIAEDEEFILTMKDGRTLKANFFSSSSDHVGLTICGPEGDELNVNMDIENVSAHGF